MNNKGRKAPVGAEASRANGKVHRENSSPHIIEITDDSSSDSSSSDGNSDSSTESKNVVITVRTSSSKSSRHKKKKRKTTTATITIVHEVDSGATTGNDVSLRINDTSSVSSGAEKSSSSYRERNKSKKRDKNDKSQIPSQKEKAQDVIFKTAKSDSQTIPPQMVHPQSVRNAAVSKSTQNEKSFTEPRQEQNNVDVIQTFAERPSTRSSIAVCSPIEEMDLTRNSRFFERREKMHNKDSDYPEEAKNVTAFNELELNSKDQGEEFRGHFSSMDHWTFGNPELLNIDEDEFVYTNDSNIVKSEANPRGEQQIERSEFDTVNLNDSSGDLTGSLPFAGNSGAGIRFNEFSAKEFGAVRSEMLKDYPEVIVLSDSEEDDGPWRQELWSHAQSSRENRQRLNTRSEKNVQEEYEERDTRAFIEETTKSVACCESSGERTNIEEMFAENEHSFCSDCNNNNEGNDFDTETRVFCEKVERNGNSGNGLMSRKFLNENNRVSELKSSSENARAEGVSEKQVCEKKRSREHRQQDSETSVFDKEKSRDKKRARLEKKSSQEERCEGEGDKGGKKYYGPNVCDEGRSSEDEMYRHEKRTRNDRYYEEKGSGDHKRSSHAERVRNENQSSDGARADGAIRSCEETQARDRKYVQERKRPHEAKKSRDKERAREEKGTCDVKIIREEKRSGEKKRSIEEKRDAKRKFFAKFEKRSFEENRFANEKRRAEEKRSKEKKSVEEKRSVDENRFANEKRSTEEKRIEKEKKSVEEKRSVEENRFAKEKKSVEEKRSVEGNRLVNDKRRVEEKRSTEEKRLAKEKKSVEEKRSVEGNRLVNDKHRVEEKGSTEEKRIEKEKKSVEEKRSVEGNRFANEKRRVEEKRLAKEKKSVEENRFANEKRRVEQKRSTEEKLFTKEIKSADEKRSVEGSRSVNEKRRVEGKIETRHERQYPGEKKYDRGNRDRDRRDKSDHGLNKSVDRVTVNETKNVEKSEHKENSHKYDQQLRHYWQEYSTGISSINNKIENINRQNSSTLHISKDPRLTPHSRPVVVLTQMKPAEKVVPTIESPIFPDGEQCSASNTITKQTPNKEKTISELQNLVQSRCTKQYQFPAKPSSPSTPKLTKKELAQKARLAKKVYVRDQQWRRILHPWAKVLPISKKPSLELTYEERREIKSYRREKLKEIAEQKKCPPTDEPAAKPLSLSEAKATDESLAKNVAQRSAKVTAEPRGFFLFSKPLEKPAKKNGNSVKETTENKRESIARKKIDSQSTNVGRETIDKNERRSANEAALHNHDTVEALERVAEESWRIAEEFRNKVDEFSKFDVKESRVPSASNATQLPNTDTRVSVDDNTMIKSPFRIGTRDHLQKAKPTKFLPRFVDTFWEQRETDEIFFLELDVFLWRVLQWSPKWLVEKNQTETSPLIVDVSKLSSVLSDYQTYDQYYNIVEPLLTLETWHGILKDSEVASNNKHMFSIVTNSIRCCRIGPANKSLSLLVIDVVVSLKDLGIQAHPVYGDLVSLEYQTNNKSSGLSTCSLFAYVTDLRKSTITDLRDVNINLCNLLSFVEAPCTVVRYIVMTKELDSRNVRVNTVNQLQTITHLRSNMRMFQALRDLPKSPLLNIILHPKVEDYQLSPAINMENYPLVTKDSLNARQMEAVIRITDAVRQKRSKICLVQGPPGTGKSKVIVNLVAQILHGENRLNNFTKLRILLCTPSNAAIDEIVLRLLNLQVSLGKRKRFKIVRIGQTKMMNPLVQPVSLKQLAYNQLVERRTDRSEYERLKCKITMRDMEDEVLMSADVIASTLSSCYTNQMESAFARNSKAISVCIVDEATQSAEPECLIPLMLGVRVLVLVGDTKQLPATILSQKAKKLGLDQSIFARISRAFQGELKNPIIHLNKQYRMSNPVAQFPNKYFYGGSIVNAAIMHKLPFQFYRVLNLVSTQDSTKFSNANEASFVAKLIYTMIASAKYDNAVLPVKLGIITPYNDQKALLRKKIKESIANLEGAYKIKYEVNTVDSFQGQERDVIIMSCVRSSGIGFLSDRQRLCVALTRAKHSLILCGNFKTFQRDSMWKELLSDAQSRGVFINVKSKAGPKDLRSYIIR